MSQKKTENSLFSNRDAEYNNFTNNETNPQEIHNNNGQMSYPDNYLVDQPPVYWDPSMQYMSYGQYSSPMPYNQSYDNQTIHPAQPQYSSIAYNQPYDYQGNQSIQQQYPPNSVTQPAQSPKTYHLQNSSALPPAPLGRTPFEQVAVPLAPSVFNHASVPIPPAHVQQALPPAMSSQYAQPPLPLPRHHSRDPPPPHYDDNPRLPRIRRKHKRREYDDRDRYRSSDPIIVSYFPQRYDDHTRRQRNRWYH
ncbi:unnamed protein product [Rotaria sordida]|uniref:Uncharacterized protein n=1 Tax=Rotaria sordida TaxID=392033 RepID=A0A814N062_9BILA|nr:unnamed protein product [Rotaria sordida]CAF1086555.1 unnamed protein product [Rotaria sordida]CAF3491206.1 unnamed protein product [Rotaria sordida]CAF3938846.1 unnamed protein product [Rotaria sordida]